MSAAFSMSSPAIFDLFGNAISSPVSAAGPMPSASPGGIATERSGPDHVPVSRLAQPVNGKASLTNGIYGLPSPDLLRNADLPLFSASRLAAQAGGFGLMGSRICDECSTEKPLGEFYEQPGGYRKICKACSRLIEQQRASTRREYKNLKAKEYRKTNRARELIRLARQRAQKKGLKFSLEEGPIRAALDVGVCELTGIPFNLDGGKTWDSPSLDRIDPTLGYSRTNVRVVLHCLNVMANVWGIEKIIEMADALMAARRSPSQNLQDRLESALKRQINLENSPEFALTWSSWDMPSGVPICRLRASAHRTSASGCSGWPTPCESDKKGASGPNCAAFKRGDINRLAGLAAGWPTPATPNGGRSVDISQMDATGRTADGRKHTASLEHAVKFAGSGTMPSGFPASTEKRGALNPLFSLWLMGYPTGWASCGEAVTLSSHRPQRSSSVP